ncbi:aminotransferase-like domain-containing protein [Actinomarinicola tropica]|uniref:Aminotransferase class I/II-fold pyridoxal phosphate-dependent enzyme n=1 Tax=Actinomarinicola tropica TaxID=2789776 RepID=A0A5Q2RNK6_9ACTN|nr:PLP-dependent aminotransferase family protein [Actinomarinicola tropica]QGG96171.1 aminotransferase class I/II-fold pyridoxal phosphate-dependent enzyme [Actinomarinicola tropica]
MLLSRRAAGMSSSTIRDLLHLADRPEVISLAGGLPDPDGFPLDAIRDAVAHVLAGRTTALAALQYSSTEGDPGLRAWIAARHAAVTGRPTSPSQVLVTTGSQQGLDLLGRVLADPGDVAVVEEPGYLGAIQALRADALDVRGIPVDDDGLRTDALEDALRRGLRPRLVYTVPTFQNPTGTTLPDARRRHLAGLADRYGFAVVEDEPYTDLRFGGAPVVPVAAQSDRVVTLGTFSKTLAPGLRVGWLVGPAEVVAAATRAKQAVDLHTAGIAQQIALALVTAPGGIDEHVRRVAATYAERARALRAALVEAIGLRYELTDPGGGMFLWAAPRSDDAPDAAALLHAAIARGTAFVPGEAFVVGELTPRRRGAMRLSFATAPPDDLRVAASRLAAALDDVVGRDIRRI